MKKPGQLVKDRKLTAEEKAWEKHMQSGLEEAERRLAEVKNWPTVAELTQLAATLRRGDGECDVKALAEEAWELWFGCRAKLREELRNDVTYYDCKLACGMDPDCSEEVNRPRVRFVNGKADFEAALKALVGEKTRKADRYRIFREFMRAQVRKNSSNKDEQKIEATAEKRFMELKEGGFPQQSFHKAESWFVEWRKERRRERAKHAAKERWKDDEEKAAAATDKAAKESEKA